MVKRGRFIGQNFLYAGFIKKGVVSNMIYLWILLFPAMFLWKLAERA